MTAPSLPQVRDAATAWIEAGVSVVPVGTAKRPTVKWEPYQAAAPTLDQAQQWWGNGRPYGYAIICGQVSGNLEMTELEAAAMTEEGQGRLFDTLDRYNEAGYDIYNLLWYGYRQHSPAGGVHLAYRISDHPVPGNEKIARRPATEQELIDRPGNKYIVLAETRGEGGYFVGAGSPGLCHPSGNPWILHHGDIGSVPTITWAQRQLWHQILAEALDESPPEPERPAAATMPAVPRTEGFLSPGDDYENRTDWAEILEPHGWQFHSISGGTTNWTRPGKERRDGISATTGHAGDRDRLFVFSSSTDFAQEHPYTKFGAYTLLTQGSETSVAFAAATKELARQGYGDVLPAAADAADTDFMGNQVEVPADNLPAVAGPKKFYRWDDDGNAMRLWDRIKDRARYVPDMKDWMRFDGKRWIEDQEAQGAHLGFMAVKENLLKEADESDDDDLRKYARTLGKSSVRNAAVATATKLPGVRAGLADFDARQELLNLPNGILDPVTRELTPHDPTLLMTRLLGTEFDPTATAPTWDRYLSEVLPNTSMRNYVRRAVGYTLMANPNQRAIFFVYGGAGTGKSTFLEIIRSVFHHYGQTVSSSTFREKRGNDGPTTDLHSMRGKRFVSTSETMADAKFEEDLLKRLSGGDSITSRELYQKPVEWQPECVLWLTTNYVPNFTFEDDAIWKRTKMIPFTEKFEGEREDPNMKRKLRLELPGILNWILEGVQDYLANGLGEPSEVADQVQTHRTMSDQVVEFVADIIDAGQFEYGEDRKVRTKDLYSIYLAWCRDRQLKNPLGSRRFGHRMQSVTGGIPVKEGGYMHWHGLGPANGWILGAA